MAKKYGLIVFLYIYLAILSITDYVKIPWWLFFWPVLGYGLGYIVGAVVYLIVMMYYIIFNRRRKT